MILCIIIGLVGIKAAVWLQSQVRVISTIACSKAILGHTVPGLVSMFGSAKSIEPDECILTIISTAQKSKIAGWMRPCRYTHWKQSAITCRRK